ncbi:MAG: hypothetical protein JWM59_2435 [Verrucomicrobiales bacterium]|nr:hypothetical protein [Verrucomicrobiales bacterium]
MKLFIALTPAILIGCAMVETWASIATKNQPASPAASVVRTPVRVPVFTFGETRTAVGAIPSTTAPWAVAQAQASRSAQP